MAAFTTGQTAVPRSVSRIFSAPRMIEGEEFEVRRAIPSAGVPAIRPFILLDHFGPVNYGPDEAKGAPNHPHRGFETLTYLLEGGGMHRDSLGNVSVIGAGEAQWMRADGKPRGDAFNCCGIITATTWRHKCESLVVYAHQPVVRLARSTVVEPLVPFAT
jgi:hypothetical protein